MKPKNAVVVDSSIWIEIERRGESAAAFFAEYQEVATCLAAVGEFCVGLHAPRQAATREAARHFFSNYVAKVAWHEHPQSDFLEAGELIGKAIRSGRVPSFADGLIAACAKRLGYDVATKDVEDFNAMGCRAVNPFEPASLKK